MSRRDVWVDDPAYWREAGKADRVAGNDAPALTTEDFHREIFDPALAAECYEAYRSAFYSIPPNGSGPMLGEGGLPL